MDDNTISSNEVVKGCDCKTWLRILCDEFLGLFHRTTPVDALPLPDDESSVGNKAIFPDEEFHLDLLFADDEFHLDINESIVGSSMTSIMASNITSNGSNNLLFPDDEFHLELLFPDDEFHLDINESSMTSIVASNITSNGSKNLFFPDDEFHLDLLFPDDEFHLDNELIAASNANFLLLPDEVIIDILSRLTFECVVQCRGVCRSLRQLTSTQDYNSMLLTQTAPVIAIQSGSLCCKTFDKENKLRSYHVILHFVNQDNNIVALKTNFNLNYMPEDSNKPSLIGSYHGLLWFSHKYEKGLIILNPVTKEQVIVKAPSKYYLPCGLYFHISTGEYRVLYVRIEEEGEYRFNVLNLRSKLLREIGKCAVAPCTCTSPTILNGGLYWMASVGCYMCNIRKTPPCSESILLFNTNEEVVTTMAHPGGYCNSKERHRTMQLLEKDGKLCLLDTFRLTFELYLWVLEDCRQEKVWVIERVIDIKLMGIFYLSSLDSHNSSSLTALDIRNGEILLKSGSFDILRFNLKTGTFKKVDRNKFGNEDLSHAVVHKPTFATLKCDSVISLV